MADRLNYTMSPKERVEAVKNGKPFDYIPCNLSVLGVAPKYFGIDPGELAKSTKKAAEVQISAYRKFGVDTLSSGHGGSAFADYAGSRVVYPKGSTPYIDDFVIKEYDDLDRLPRPDQQNHGGLQNILESVFILQDKVGDEALVDTGIPGPMTLANSLRGCENLMRDIRRNPEFVHRLLDYCVELTIPFAREAAKLGSILYITDPVSSGSVLSPKNFREFSLPYLKKLISAINEAGPRPTLHICGNTNKILKDMADSGAGLLSLDNIVDLEFAKQEVGDQIPISGNVRPTESMFLGTPEIVEEDVKSCINKAWDSPKGFILALGCGLPLGTPVENVFALIQAARKYGKYSQALE